MAENLRRVGHVHGALAAILAVAIAAGGEAAAEAVSAGQDNSIFATSATSTRFRRTGAEGVGAVVAIFEVVQDQRTGGRRVGAAIRFLLLKAEVSLATALQLQGTPPCGGQQALAGGGGEEGRLAEALEVGDLLLPVALFNRGGFAMRVRMSGAAIRRGAVLRGVKRGKSVGSYFVMLLLVLAGRKKSLRLNATHFSTYVNRLHFNLLGRVSGEDVDEFLRSCWCCCWCCCCQACGSRQQLLILKISISTLFRCVVHAGAVVGGVDAAAAQLTYHLPAGQPGGDRRRAEHLAGGRAHVLAGGLPADDRLDAKEGAHQRDEGRADGAAGVGLPLLLLGGGDEGGHLKGHIADELDRNGGDGALSRLT